jgi:glycosyl transferase, family 25
MTVGSLGDRPGRYGMRILLINLDRCPQRLAWMASVLAERGLTFERVRAVDWQALSAQEIDEHRIERHRLGPLPPGDIACFLSHRKCWETISRGADDYVCIDRQEDTRPGRHDRSACAGEAGEGPRLSQALARAGEAVPARYPADRAGGEMVAQPFRPGGARGRFLTRSSFAWRPAACRCRAAALQDAFATVRPALDPARYPDTIANGYCTGTEARR